MWLITLKNSVKTTVFEVHRIIAYPSQCHVPNYFIHLTLRLLSKSDVKDSTVIESRHIRKSTDISRNGSHSS